MPDADDILVNGDALRTLLTAFAGQVGPRHNAYNVAIRRDNLTYHLPLIFRTSAKWRYRYRVHEIAGPSEGEGYAEIKLPIVYTTQSRPPQSAEATQRRWERDLRILREDYIKDPRDPRTLFYLAQTYECLSRPVEALKVYRERVAVGGWYEETYEAKLRIAKILDALERRSHDKNTKRDDEEIRIAPSWPEVQDAFFALYAERPTHAEPLFHIARHWYDAQKHPLAFIFAERVARTPIPQQGLFIDAAVYEWRAAEIASISGFYCNDLGDERVHESGRRMAEKCVRAQPGNELFRSNWAFYAPAAANMFPGYVEKPIGIQPEHPYVANNPSVFFDHATKTWSCLVRTTNYRIIDGNYLTHDENGKLVSAYERPINTRNYYLTLDDDLNVTKQTELIDRTDIPKSTYPCHGYEDSRLFKWRGEWCCTATVCDFNIERGDVGPREIVLYHFNPENGDIVSAHPLRGPWSEHAQKNWMPIVLPDATDDLRIIYAVAPHSTEATIATVNNATMATTFNKPFYGHGRLRGGSQAVRIPDVGYLCIVHDVAWPGSGRIYVHRFVQLDTNLKIVAMSDPFHFRKLGIEFCAGLAWDGDDKLVASFGMEDREPYFGTFSLKSILSALRTDYVI
jgi:hypothetical protein